MTSTSHQNTRLCEYKVELGNIEQSIKQLHDETITPMSSKIKHIEEQIKSTLDANIGIHKEIKQLQHIISTIKETGLQSSMRLDEMEIREKEREEQSQQMEQQRLEKDKERQQFNELLLEKLKQMKSDIATHIKNTAKEQKDKYDELIVKYNELESIHKQLDQSHKQLETEHKQLDQSHKQLSSSVAGLSQHQAHLDEKLTLHIAKHEQDVSSLNTKHQQFSSQHKQDIDKHSTYLANLREELSKQDERIQTESQSTKQTMKQLETKYNDLQKDIQSQLQKERQSLYEKYVDTQRDLEKEVNTKMSQIQISLHDTTKYMKVNLEQQMRNKDEDVFQLKQQVQQLQKQLQTIKQSPASTTSTSQLDLETIKPILQQMINAQMPRQTAEVPCHSLPSETSNLEGLTHEIRTLKNELVLIKRRLKYLEEHSS